MSPLPEFFPLSRARKEHKKVPFLNALTRIGSISTAAKAVRISRDAVHDWKRSDPAFMKAFHVAKNQYRLSILSENPRMFRVPIPTRNRVVVHPGESCASGPATACNVGLGNHSPI